MSLWLANLTAARQLSSTDKLCSKCWLSFQLSHQYDWQLRKQADVRTGLVLGWILHNWAQTLSLTFYHRRWGINHAQPLSILRGEMNVMKVLSKGDLHYVRLSKTTKEWRLNNPKQDGVMICGWNSIFRVQNAHRNTWSCIDALPWLNDHRNQSFYCKACFTPYMKAAHMYFGHWNE